MVSRFLLNSFCSFGFTPRDGTKGQCSGAESILSPLTRAPAGVDGACAVGWGGRAGCVHVMGALGGRRVRRITVSSQYPLCPNPAWADLGRTSSSSESGAQSVPPCSEPWNPRFTPENSSQMFRAGGHVKIRCPPTPSTEAAPVSHEVSPAPRVILLVIPPGVACL